MWRRIHVTGAPGAGISTLAQELAERIRIPHIETDDFFWAKSVVPYSQKRPVQERTRLLKQRLDASPDGWILAGALEGWGDPLIPLFQLVVFVQTTGTVRLTRLGAREATRFGDRAIEPGGDMHAQHRDFIQWAADYDDPNVQTRNIRRHVKWLSALPCPVVQVNGERPVAETARFLLDVCEAERA
jgi:adenylate kinase family enzyme